MFNTVEQNRTPLFTLWWFFIILWLSRSNPEKVEGGLLLGNVFKHVVVTVCYLEICPQRGRVGSLKKMIRWGPRDGTILVDL